MNPVLNSNASSALVSVLDKVDTQHNPFEYKYAKNEKGTSLASCSRSWQETTTTSSVALNSAIDFHLSKNGILNNIVIKMKLKKTSTDLVNASIGALQIREVQLLSSGRVVASQTAESLLSLVASQPYASKKALENLLNLQSGVAGTSLSNTEDFTAYVPILFSCFESNEKKYNLNFVEPLVLRVFTADAGSYVMDNSTNPVTTSISLEGMSLFCEYINVPAQMEQKMIQGDFGSGEPLSRVQWNLAHEYTEQLITAGQENVMTHEIKSNNVVQEMYIYMDSGYDDGVKGVKRKGAGMELKNIKIESNGITIANLDGKLFGMYGDKSEDQFPHLDGSYWDTTNNKAGTNYRYKYNFGLSADTRRVFGSSAFRELNNFKVIATTTNGVVAEQIKARLHVCLKYAQLESIAGESGRITTSISS